MIYYIINNVDYVFIKDNLPPEKDYPLDTIIILNEKQMAFYLANPKASANEIINCKLNESIYD